MGGAEFSTGTVVAMGFEDFLAGGRDFTLVVEPGPRSAAQGVSSTHDLLVVSVLDNVRSQLWIYRPDGGAWAGDRIDAPEMGTVGVVETDLASNTFFFQHSSLDQPTSLYVRRDAGSVERT